MRVISGQLGGQNFDSPRGHRTHPMADKIRGALFAVLGDIKGLTVLDAFSGSGALAIEAISRGASSATAIDIDKQAYETIQANVLHLGLHDQITVMRKNLNGWTRNNQHQQFDLVFADPPYNDIDPRLLQRLAAHVKPEGTYVLSWPGSEKIREFTGLRVVASKSYGDAQLVFYKRT